MASIIEVQGLQKTFIPEKATQGIEAIGDISLSIEKGEFLSIVGPSGCGKSTLLNIIAGFDFPTQGKVSYRGEEICGPSCERGVCFQEYSLFPWKTVMGNVEFGLQARRLPEKERKSIAFYFIELVGLKGFEDKFPHELSGGMRQRCALARTFANNPDVLIMDEPLAAVDAQTRNILQEELLNIWGQEKKREERKTVVYVTHSIEESVFLSDRVVIITARPGKIKAIVDINLSRPRKDETRGTEQFAELNLKIWSSLKTEILKTQRDRFAT
jgi:NitT/TauT family transport system ATP-binding protein